MNKAPNDLVKNDVFVNILSEKLSDEDLQRMFSFHGEIQFTKSANNDKKLKTEKQIVINFESRSRLLRTMAAIHRTLKEIKKNDFLINNLPDNCLLHIFSFLPFLDKLNIEKVCKRWRDISGRVFTGTTELDLRYHWSGKTIYSSLKQCGPLTKILKLPLSKDFKILLVAMQFCQLDQLMEIHLDCRSSTRSNSCPTHLTKFFEKTKNLVTLVITGNLKNYNIDQVTLLGSQTLENLTIYNEGKRESLRINQDQFPNLREFYCENVEILQIEGQIRPKSSTNLERLELHNNKLSRSFIETIKSCTNLKKIILNKNARQMNANDIVGIMKNCQKIEELHLVGSFVLTPPCFQAFGGMSSLESLRINSLGKAESLHLQHLTNLKELTIDDCSCMNEHMGLTQLITNSSKLSKLNLFNATELDEIFLEAVHNIFRNGLRKTPLILRIEVKYTWGRKYNYNSGNPLLKLQLI